MWIGGKRSKSLPIDIIILAKNEEAKSFNIVTGEAIWTAKQKCPNLVVLKPNYSLYLKFSKKARKIYYDYTDQVESFGLDEAWLDCTYSATLFGNGENIAQVIRKRIKDELGLTVSIGVSWNKIFAKFGSDFKKPDAVTVIDRNNYKDIIWKQSVGDLLYIGSATKRKLYDIGVTTIGRLAKMSRSRLKLEFGKIGLILYDFANGLDETPVSELNTKVYDNFREIKSIGNSTTTPRDLITMEDFKLVLTILSESVAARLRELGCLGNTVEIHIRYNDLDGLTRQKKLKSPTDITHKIIKTAETLFIENYDFLRPIRSLGVRITDLILVNTPHQLNFFEDLNQDYKEHCLDLSMDHLRQRFGNNCIRRGITINDEISNLDPKKDNIIHPISYFC